MTAEFTKVRIVHECDGRKVYELTNEKVVTYTRVALALDEDPFAPELVLTVGPGDLNTIIEAINLDNELPLDFAPLFVLEVFHELGRDPQDALLVAVSKQLTNDNVLPLFESAIRFHGRYEIFADYAAAHFGELAPKMANFSDALVDLTMRSHRMDTSDVAGFVTKRVDIQKDPNHRLTKFLPLRMLIDIPGFDMTLYRGMVSSWTVAPIEDNPALEKVVRAASLVSFEDW